MAKLAIRPQALSDLDDIFDYIAEDSLNRAAGFIKKLYEQMGKVADNPSIGRRRDRLLPGLRSFPYGNYLIFYIPIDNGVDVVRVLNGARDIEALFNDDGF
jgi:toxin ParE1/3/4